MFRTREQLTIDQSFNTNNLWKIASLESYTKNNMSFDYYLNLYLSPNYLYLLTSPCIFLFSPSIIPTISISLSPPLTPSFYISILLCPLSPSLPHYIYLYIFIPLYISLSLTHIPYFPLFLSLYLSHSHKHILPISPSPLLSLSLSLDLIHSSSFISHTLSIYPSLPLHISLPISLSLYFPLSHCFSLSIDLCIPLPLSISFHLFLSLTAFIFYKLYILSLSFLSLSPYLSIIIYPSLTLSILSLPLFLSTHHCLFLYLSTSTLSKMYTLPIFSFQSISFYLSIFFPNYHSPSF